MSSRIKICGLRRPCDIDYVNELMPDYIGFVFAKSRRQVSVPEAERLKNRLAAGICAVGVFVNEKPERVAEIVKAGIIDMVQMHGQEDESCIRRLRAILADIRQDGRERVPLLQAFSVRSREDVARACESGADYILLDNGAGGTGRRFDWSMIGRIDRPFFLAGGLGPDTVEEALRTGAYALDVSSGVETDGYKDYKKIKLCMERIGRKT